MELFLNYFKNITFYILLKRFSIIRENEMVLIHYKKNDHNQFLVEIPANTEINEVVASVVEINNMRIRLDIFACAIEQLATHGPLKPQEIRGLNDQQLIDNALIISSDDKKKWAKQRQPTADERFNEDKTHYRIGVIKSQNITKMMIETSNNAKKLISYKNVDLKVVLNMKMLEQAWNELKGAMTIAYPNFQGLGDWQPARLIMLNQYDWQDINTNQIDYLDPKDSTMWWAGKQFRPEKKLSDYSGKNEKTKIIVKIAKSGSGAPVREGGMDEQTRIKLMGMYHKKQQELKKIESNNEQDYANSVWANPNNLKNYLVTGGKNLKFK